MKIFFKKRKKVLAFCKKVLYTNEVGCGKQQKSRANDTNEYVDAGALNTAEIRPVGQGVKTPPSHGGNTGSIPVLAIN